MVMCRSEEYVFQSIESGIGNGNYAVLVWNRVSNLPGYRDRSINDLEQGLSYLTGVVT